MKNLTITGNNMDYHKILMEALHLHDTIDRMASSAPWSGCSCDHGHDGRMSRRGEKCPRCVADDKMREIKKMVDFDRPKREQKAKDDSLNSAFL